MKMLESGEPGCWLHYTGCRDDCEYCVNFGNWPEDWKEVVETYFGKLFICYNLKCYMM